MAGKRRIGPFEVEAIGFGCMGLSHAYGAPPDPDDAARLLNRALDLGYDHIDTAALYGFGANESLIGRAIMREFVERIERPPTGVSMKRSSSRS